MKSALTSFLITLLTAFGMVRSCQPLHSESTSSFQVSAGDPDSSATERSSGTKAAKKKAETEDSVKHVAAQLDELASRAREVSRRKSIVANIDQWWGIVCEAAAINPLRAIAMVREAPEEFLGDRIHDLSGTADDVIAWWIARDPAAALDWYWKDAASRTLDAEPPDQIVVALAHKDFDSALQFMRRYLNLTASMQTSVDGHSMMMDGLKVKEKFTLRYALRALLPSLKSPEHYTAVLSLVDNFSDPSLRAGFYQSLVATAVESMTPVGAAQCLAQHPLPADWPPDIKYPAATLAARAIALGEDPAHWIAWAMQQIGPDRDDLRAQAAKESVAAWSRLDPQTAGEWLERFRHEFPAAAAPAMRAYAATVIDKDPAAAMAWITALPDETLQRQNMLLHFPDWASRDPAAAARWLAASPWPADIKRLLGAVLP